MLIKIFGLKELHALQIRVCMFVTHYPKLNSVVSFSLMLKYRLHCSTPWHITIAPCILVPVHKNLLKCACVFLVPEKSTEELHGLWFSYGCYIME